MWAFSIPVVGIACMHGFSSPLFRHAFLLTGLGKQTIYDGMRANGRYLMSFI